MAKKIRIWKLGSLKHRIVPTEEAVEKLKSILDSSKQNDDDLNIIWGPDIKVKVVEGEDDVMFASIEEAKTFLEQRGYSVIKLISQ